MPAADHYPDTRLQFSPDFEVDLRRALTGKQRRQLLSLGLGRRFGIVTAFNPQGRQRPAAENRQRLAQLEQRLRGRRYRPADGLSLDRRHRERGFAVTATRREVLALARAFDQLAIFWFDGSRFLLVWCDRPSRGIPLPQTPDSLTL